MNLTEEEAELLDWLDDQDGYYVSSDELDRQFGDAVPRMVGITCIIKDGEVHIPKRDVRDAILHGHPLD